MNRLIILGFILCLFSCKRSGHLPEGFVYLNDVAPDVKLELRYFSSNNFVGDTIDGYLAAKCIISKPAADALKKVQKSLKSQGLGIKVFDAYRPQRAVDHFVRWAEDLSDTLMKPIYYPNVDKSKLFEIGYIAAKSGHTRGSTLDLTLVYLEGPQKGQELDMGTPWDHFDPAAWPSSDAVSDAQKQNRMILRKVMMDNGFKPLREEWWHFTLEAEPYPDTYFDFVVE
ncbi:MAG: M15 family metallopeptidase [Phaeodactylibacter sp.]|nr:M15 family metallopeptidase [Phaeodactylibacter sp.]